MASPTTALLTAHDQALDAKIAGFTETLQEIANTLKNALLDLDGVFGTEPALIRKQIVHLQVELRGQLNAAGYPELIQEFVSGYDESLIFGRQILGAIGRADVQLDPIRQHTLVNLKQFDLSKFDEIGNSAIRELSRQVTLNTLVGVKRSQVINSMNAVLDGQFANQGALYADTALRSFDRFANSQLWAEAGIDRYRYLGPNDRTTRPFCRSHVNRIYTLAQIKAMNNGTRYSDVLIYAGGPRCRHSWIPQVDRPQDERLQEAAPPAVAPEINPEPPSRPRPSAPPAGNRRQRVRIPVELAQTQ